MVGARTRPVPPNLFPPCVVPSPVPGRVPTLPQPPIVYGPSEVNEWIRGAYPSQALGSSAAKRARRIEGMAIKVWSDSMLPVRARVIVVLEALGYALEGVAERPPLRFRKTHRTIVVRLHPSILREAVTAALRFAPPALPDTATAIVDGIAREFPLGKVSMAKAARTAPPPRRERASSAVAKPRRHRPRASAKK